MTIGEIPTRPVTDLLSLRTLHVETRYCNFVHLARSIINTNSDFVSVSFVQFLLVSAVDPRGKVVYRGTSSAGATHHGKQHRTTSKAVPEGALAAKKTTEIAAMFSNIKLNQTTDIIIDDSEVTEDTASELSTDDAYSSMRRFRSNQNTKKNGFTKSMENSLGYLP